MQMQERSIRTKDNNEVYAPSSKCVPVKATRHAISEKVV
jgi:hypothetical protein